MVHQHRDDSSDAGNRHLDEAVARLQAQLAALTKAIEADPTDAKAWLARGVVRGQLAEPEKAIDDFSWAINLDDANVEAYYNRGVAYAHFQLPMMAIDDFTEAIRIDPRHMDAWNNRAAAYLETGRYESAIADAEQVLRLDDKSPTAYATGNLCVATLRCFNGQMGRLPAQTL